VGFNVGKIPQTLTKWEVTIFTRGGGGGGDKDNVSNGIRTGTRG